MGGLMASAAGALSNCAEVTGSVAPEERRACVSATRASSMAEWQISQAEQLLVWWSGPAQAVLEPSQATEAAAGWSLFKAAPASASASVFATCMPSW